MDQNLLIGAGIAIISSSIAAALTYGFQTLDANKKRRWELDDKVTEKTQKSLLDRINLIETLILDIYNCANKTIDQVGQFAGELNRLEEVNAVLTNLMIKQKTINTVSSVLEDEELSQHLSDFTKGIDKLVKLVASVPLKEGEDTPNVEPFIIELFDTLTMLDTPFQEVLKRLEKLRIKAFSSQ